MDSDDKRILDIALRQISIDKQTSSDHRPETNAPTDPKLTCTNPRRTLANALKSMDTDFLDSILPLSP